ncbi:MAG: thiol-activated cytolysin family protein, partial [Methanomassiliicoccaceae archaeon]|nr:thiol-activated cytolysin family protein [Methanomassiliicoccaceae archaeon]
MNKKLAVLCVAAAVTVSALAGALFLFQEPEGQDTQGMNEYISYVQSLYEHPYSNISVTEMTLTEVMSKGYIPYTSDGFEYIYQRNHGSNTIGDLITLGAMDSIWYPGAVLAISYDEMRNSEIRAVNLPRAPMTLSMGLESAHGINPNSLSAKVDNPSLSTVRTAVGGMISGALGPDANIPTALSCQIIEINSNEALNLAIGASGGFGPLKVSASVDYTSSSERTKAALVFQQVYFTVDMDRPTNGPAGVFSDKTTVDDLKRAVGEGDSLVYCSVIYGKFAVVMIETDMSMSDLKATFSASYSSIASVQASLEMAMSQSQTTMDYFVYGGSEELRGIITSATVSDAAKAIADSSVISPKPIGYRFHYLDDGNIAKISTYNEYITRQLVPIRVDNVSFAMKDNITGEEVTKARAGSTIVPLDESILPVRATVYTKEYSVISHNNAPIDRYTGRFTIPVDALPGDIYTIRLTITQTILGSTYTKTADVRVEVLPISVTNISIDSNTPDDKINAGGSVTLT